MRKPAPAILVLLSLFLFGCTADQYAIEKQYYHITKMVEKILKNPHASPPSEVQKVVGILNDFSQKHPKTNLAIEAEFNIVRLYIVKKEHESARGQLNKIIGKYSENASISTEGMFLIGNTYEMEDNWAQALTTYSKIIKEHPLTIRGLQIPIYLIQHYKVKLQPDKMIAASQEAISHYQSLAAKNPDSPLAYNAHVLIAECHLLLKEWQSAIDTYNSIIDNYKSKVGMDNTLMTIASIYLRELKDNKKAKETLERLIQDYPKSNLINSAKSALKGIKE